MSDVPVLRVTDVIKKLRRAGFVFDRQAKGSHEIWFHPDPHRRVVIPNHSGDIPKSTLRKIIQQAGLTIEEFKEL